MSRTAVLPVATLLVAASLVLGGCSLLPQIPDFGGGSGSQGADSDSGGIDDNPLLNHEVPDSFPADIPLPNLAIVFSLDLGTGWSVIYHADDLDADYDGVKSGFADAGWDTIADSTSDEGHFGVFGNDKYQVQISAAYESSDYDGPILAYTVVATG